MTNLHKPFSHVRPSDFRRQLPGSRYIQNAIQLQSALSRQRNSITILLISFAKTVFKVSDGP